MLQRKRKKEKVNVTHETATRTNIHISPELSGLTPDGYTSSVIVLIFPVGRARSTLSRIHLIHPVRPEKTTKDDSSDPRTWALGKPE